MRVHAATFVTGAASLRGLPDTALPEAAFAGRSNVGKSSLINMLLGRKNLARTSGKPGKTQQLNFYLINGAFHLVDLPGYGYARVSRTEREAWTRLIGRYLETREQLRALVHLVDSRHEPTELDLLVMDFMRGRPLPYLIALTKTDKLSGNGRTRAIQYVRRPLEERGMDVPVVPTSAENARGRDEMWEWIGAMMGLTA
jgi:GTP-binding protein